MKTKLALGSISLTLLLAACGGTAPNTVPAGETTPVNQQPSIQQPHLDKQSFVAGELVVGLRAGAHAADIANLLGTGARVKDTSSALNAALITLPEGMPPKKAALLLKSSPLVSFAEPNYVAYAPQVTAGGADLGRQSPSTQNVGTQNVGTQNIGSQTLGEQFNDPEVGYQWFLRNMDVEGAWAHSTGAGIRIGVADEDIDRHHPDLAANIVYPGYDSADDVLITPQTPHDGHGQHGTWVAGTSSAVANNGIGGVGVAPDSKVVPLTITHNDGASYWDSAEAFVFGVTGPDGINPSEAGDTDTPEGHIAYVDVLNYSFGGDNYSQILREGIQYALKHGVVFVTSAGNTPTEGSGSAAWVPGVVSVAASDGLDTRTDFSNMGNHLSVAAPGENIWVPGTREDTEDAEENNYAYVNGTSFSGPATAGAAALILAAERDSNGTGTIQLTPAQVRHILENTAYQPSGELYSNELGYGIVRTGDAVAMAMNDAANKVEKGASLEMQFVVKEEPEVGVPLVGVTLAGGDRRPNELLYGQSSSGDYVFPAGQASFYEIDAGNYTVYASGPRPIQSGLNPDGGAYGIQLAPGEQRIFGNADGVFPLRVTLPKDANEGDTGNDTLDTAAPLGIGTVAYGVMPNGDVDIYSFTAQAGQEYFVNTQTLLGNTDLQVHVLNAAGEVVAENQNYRERLSDAALIFTAEQAGNYFVEVSDEAGGSAFNTYWMGITHFAGNAPELGEGGSVSDTTFANLQFDKALLTAVGNAHRTNVDAGGEVDIYQLEGVAGQTLVIDTLATETGKPDMLLALYDSEGTQLALNDDTTTQDSTVVAELTQSGTYYAVATSWDARTTGEYIISFMTEAGE